MSEKIQLWYCETCRIEDIIMPYIVTPDGRTIAEHIAPKLAEMREATHDKLLLAGGVMR